MHLRPLALFSTTPDGLIERLHYDSPDLFRARLPPRSSRYVQRNEKKRNDVQ